MNTSVSRETKKIASLSKFPSENPNPILRIAKNGTILYANAAAQFILDGWRSAVDKAAPDRWIKRIQQVLDTGSQMSAEFKHENQIFSVDLSPIVDQDYVNIYGRDITERKKAEDRILQQNTFLNNVIESFPHPFIVVDANDYTLHVANSATGLDSLSENLTCYKLIYHSKNQCTVQPCPLDTVKTTKKPTVIECIQYDDNGNERIIEVHGYPIIDHFGNVVQMIEYFVDITERRKIEDKYRAVIRDSIDGFAIGEITGNLIEVNDAFCRMLRYSRDELLTLTISDLEAIESPQAIRKHIEKIITQGYDEFESQLRGKHGDLVDVLVTTRLSEDTNTIYAFFKNITDRKYAERVLKENEEQFIAIAENSYYGILIGIGHGQLVYANAKASEITGYSRAELLAQPIIDFIAPDYRNEVMTRFQQRLAGEHPETIWVSDIITKSGNRKTIEVTGTLIAWQGHAAEMVNFIDITERLKTQEQLKTSEEQFRSLFESMHDGIIISGSDGRIISANTAASDLVGYDKAERLIGLHTNSFYEDSEQRKILIEKLMKKGHIRNHEVRGRRNDGTAFDALVSLTLHKDEDSEITKIEGIFRDISERKRLESERNLERKRLQQFFEKLPLPAYMVAVDGTILNCNQQAVKMLNYQDTSELIGQPLLSTIYAPSSKKQARQLFHQWKRTGEIRNAELQIITQQGAVRDVLLNADAIYNTDGQILASISTHLDITTHKKAMDIIQKYSQELEKDVKQRTLALQESEQRYRQLFLNARDGILITDPNGAILAANPAATRILGYPNVSELQAKSVGQIYADSKRRQVVNQQLNQKGFLDNIEVQLKQRSGNIIDVEASVILRKDKNGRITQIESIFTDITNRKRAERAMRRRLTKYRLDESQLYLVENILPTIAYAAFKDLLNAGYNGVVMTRVIEHDFRQMVDGKFTYYRLAKNGVNVFSPEAKTLQNIIEKHPRNTVFLLDHLEYMRMQQGFEETLNFMYWLRDLIYTSNNISIIVANPTLFTEQERSALQKETRPIVVRHPQIPNDLLDIIQFIHNQNSFGVQPKYGDVQQHIGVSKPTVSKRIQQLVEHGYVQQYTRGSRKCLQLTFVGMQLVNQ